MNINIGDYLIATDEIGYTYEYWNKSYNDCLKKFQIFEITNIYENEYEAEITGDDGYTMTINISKKDLAYRCVKLKVEEVY